MRNIATLVITTCVFLGCKPPQAATSGTLGIVNLGGRQVEIPDQIVVQNYVGRAVYYRNGSVAPSQGFSPWSGYGTPMNSQYYGQNGMQGFGSNYTTGSPYPGAQGYNFQNPYGLVGQNPITAQQFGCQPAGMATNGASGLACVIPAGAMLSYGTTPPLTAFCVQQISQYQVSGIIRVLANGSGFTNANGPCAPNVVNTGMTDFYGNANPMNYSNGTNAMTYGNSDVPYQCTIQGMNNVPQMANAAGSNPGLGGLFAGISAGSMGMSAINCVRAGFQ